MSTEMTTSTLTSAISRAAVAAWAGLVTLLLVVGTGLPATAAASPGAQLTPSGTARTPTAVSGTDEEADLVGVPSAHGVIWYFVPSYASAGAPVASVGIDLTPGENLAVTWRIPTASEAENVRVEWEVESQPTGGALTVTGPAGRLLLSTGDGGPHDATWKASATQSTVWRAETPGTYELRWTTSLVRGEQETSGESGIVEVRVTEPTGPGTRPDGQSDRPAPASQQKDVIENVHTDMVSAYLDSGKLTLAAKADIPTGNGIDLGRRFDPVTTLFHLSDAGRTSVPSQPGLEFLGSPGSTIWMAPQLQDPAIIWPGFSTEDPNLRGKASSLTVRLTDVAGPGEVEVFMTGTGIQRIFSSRTSLPSWTIGIPQHTHMNWAFTEPGTYRLTFEMSGSVDGSSQRASNTYTMVVGDLVAHTRSTNVRLASDRGTILQGEGALLTATVSPRDAAGVVQIRNRTTGAVLGHSPVRNGIAEFLADTLVAGRHDLAAEFVPAYSNDFTASSSSAVTINVRGQVFDRPSAPDTSPVQSGDLAGLRAGDRVTVADGAGVSPGAEIQLTIRDGVTPGEWVSAWIVGPQPLWLGWLATDANRNTTLRVPSELSPGTYSLAVKNTAGALLGWDNLTVSARGGGNGPGGPGGGPGGGGTGGGSAPPPTEAPPPSQNPSGADQVCRPQITLDHGHIDAFYVSAANGRAVLQLMEDVTGYHVIREAESVLLRVKESAYRSNIPAGTPGAPSGYVLPLTQNSSLIWPGWDTNRTSASGYSDVTIRITSVNGPGTVRLFTRGAFGDIQSLLNSGGYTLPGAIREPKPAHTHAEWVFSEKGVYILTAHAVATNPETGARLTTASHRYVFQVGDVPLGDVFCTVRPAAGQAALARQVNTAVNEAAAEAAEEELEAAAAEQAEGPELGGISGTTALGPAEGAEDIAAGTGALTVRELSPVTLGLVLGGGVMLIGAIVGGTIWYVRRLGRS